MTHLLDADRLFLATLEDLRERVVSQDAYEILGSAGLIRKLFLDDHPLVDQVNRRHRLKVEFALVPTVPLKELQESGDVYYDSLDTLDPTYQAHVPEKVVRVTRDAFFGALVAYAWGQGITIRDIVTFEANVAGGVHAPHVPREAVHQTLEDLRQRVIVKGHSVSLYHLRNIGRLVLNALEPLRNQVQLGLAGGS